MSKKRRELSRGFTHAKVKLDKSAQYICSCNSCKFNDSDTVKEIDCTNSEVSEFDMVNDDGRIFCCYWKSYEDGEE